MDKRFLLLLAVVVGMVSQVSSKGVECPAGYHLLEYGTCLKLYASGGPRRTTFEEANAKCQEDGGQLISLDTPDKMEQFSAKAFELENVFSAPPPYWVGVKKTGSVWRWLNGEELSLRSYMWLPGEPNEKFNHSHALVLARSNNPRYYLAARDEGYGSACEKNPIS